MRRVEKRKEREEWKSEERREMKRVEKWFLVFSWGTCASCSLEVAVLS